MSNYQGYLCKSVTYSGGNRVYKIEIKEQSGGRIIWIIPDSDTIASLFNQEDLCLIAKGEKGITIDSWRFLHTTAFDQNARCEINFYSRKCDLKTTDLKVEDNKNIIKGIDNILAKHKGYDDLMKDAKELLHDLPKFKNELQTIMSWKEHIFKKHSENHRFVAECIAKYNECVFPEHKISINKTNQKHTHRQIWLDQDDTKKDDKNDNQHNSLPSNVSSSVLTIATLLGILLNEIKNNQNNDNNPLCLQ